MPSSALRCPEVAVLIWPIAQVRKLSGARLCTVLQKRPGRLGSVLAASGSIVCKQQSRHADYTSHVGHAAGQHPRLPAHLDDALIETVNTDHGGWSTPPAGVIVGRIAEELHKVAGSEAEQLARGT